MQDLDPLCFGPVTYGTFIKVSTIATHTDGVFLNTEQELWIFPPI